MRLKTQKIKERTARPRASEGSPKLGLTERQRAFIKEALLVLPLMAVALWLTNGPEVASAGFIPIPRGLCGVFPCPEGSGDGVAIAKSLTGRIVRIVRIMIGAVATLMIVISAIKLIASQGNEEVYTKEIKTLIFAIVGLFVVGLSGEIAQIVELEKGGFLKDPNVAVQRSKLFSRTVKIAITFIKYTIGSVAVLFVIRSALVLITQGHNEEETTKATKSLSIGAIGLILIVFANTFINKIFFKIDQQGSLTSDAVRPGIDIDQLTREIASVTNIIAAVAGPVALLTLMYGGLRYILAAGEDDQIGKAKKIMQWALIGLIVIYSAFGIVSTFIARRFTGI
ncbi:hypothetical protein COV82_06315 [Candidatus Peregrinibacteria bacterium CG11_big_fil_rev_8_21_14_0_20_46_8]|nr:MAG: hypothetical protein COV82_06315 [Candidatus Peregrinibacteria bacterium CG11_big_fil_rev_8_21_14_0_20_46_8]